MGCPKCQCQEISADGVCLWCGYQIGAPAAESGRGPNENRDVPGQVELNHSRAPEKPAKEEPPPSKRETAQGPVSPKQKGGAEQPESQILSSTVSERAFKQSGPLSVKPDPKVPLPAPVPKVQRRADQDVSDRMQAPSPSQPVPKISSEPKKPAAQPDSKAGHLRVTQTVAAEATSKPFKQPDIPASAHKILVQSPAAAANDEMRMVFFPRILSGLVDLTIMMLSTGILIIAVHFIFGMHVRERASFVHWAVLSMLVYFIYSLLFIGISNQTVGMMITNLQVIVRKGKKSPEFARILARSCGYLVSLLCLGIGLIWALFDPEHQCFHDRLTNTRVVRVSSAKPRDRGPNRPGDKIAEGTTASSGTGDSEDTHDVC